MGKPLPVRLSDDMLRRLDQAADRMGMQNRTDIIKLCISSFLDYFEAHGKTSLPVDWQTILRDLDGRTHRYAGTTIRGNEAKVANLTGNQVAAFGGKIENRKVTEGRSGHATSRKKRS